MTAKVTKTKKKVLGKTTKKRVTPKSKKNAEPTWADMRKTISGVIKRNSKALKKLASL